MKKETEIFREIFNKSGLNQEEFSKKLGLTQPYISKYLNGVNPGLDKLILFAKVFNIELIIKIKEK